MGADCELEKAVDEAVRQAPPQIRAVIEALQALRGVAQITAATIVSELGSLSRFPSPRNLMGYSGMVAREYSSGNRVQRGGITKTGNGHLRRVVGEAARAYQHRPNVIGLLARRQKSLAISEEAKPYRMLFGFSPEWCSTSLRNAVRLRRNAQVRIPGQEDRLEGAAELAQTLQSHVRAGQEQKPDRDGDLARAAVWAIAIETGKQQKLANAA